MFDPEHPANDKSSAPEGRCDCGEPLVRGKESGVHCPRCDNPDDD